MVKKVKASEGAKTQEPLITAEQVVTPPGMTSPTPENIASLNPFNPNNFRVAATSPEAIGVQRVITSLRVGKPDKQTFVRAHPDPQYTIPIATIELKGESETYLVTPTVAAQIPQEITYATVTLAVDTQRNPFLWSVRQKAPDGKEHQAHISARMALAEAQKAWVRVRWNQSMGSYDVHQATGITFLSVWPDLSPSDMLRIAFANYLIDDITHPVIQRLTGKLA